MFHKHFILSNLKSPKAMKRWSSKNKKKGFQYFKYLKR